MHVKLMMGGLVLAGALSAMAEDAMHVARTNSALAPTGRFTWAAGGEVRGPMQVTPAGEVTALVARAKGEMDLVRWSADGKELLRRRVELAAAVFDSRLEPDGSLVVVDEKDIVKLGHDGRTLARRRVAELESVARYERYRVYGELRSKAAAAPEGAWIATSERLLFAGFDGKGISVPAPIGVRCEAIHQPGGRGCKESIHTVSLVANESGECLLVEELGIDHRIKGGHDRTEQLVLSLVSRTGELLAQRMLGKVESRLEWFWAENRDSRSLMPSIPDFGLVRRRYSGLARLRIAGERQGKGFIVIGSGIGCRIRQFDPRLGDGWCRTILTAGMTELSPAWTKDILIVSGDYVNTYDEAGALHYAELKPREGEPERTILNTAIGQTPGGDWIVAWHSTPPEDVNPD
jgi:hypothetical protein